VDQSVEGFFPGPSLTAAISAGGAKLRRNSFEGVGHPGADLNRTTCGEHHADGFAMHDAK